MSHRIEACKRFLQMQNTCVARLDLVLKAGATDLVHSPARQYHFAGYTCHCWALSTFEIAVSSVHAI